jgi:hypothetical protein
MNPFLIPYVFIAGNNFGNLAFLVRMARLNVKTDT